MALLTRDEILSADDIKTEIIEVPEWGGEVKVKALTGAQRDRFEQNSVEGKGKDTKVNLTNIRARLVAASVVDDNNKPIFQDSDVKALGAKSAAALNRVFEVAQRLSGLTEEDVKELTENLDEGQPDNSISD